MTTLPWGRIQTGIHRHPKISMMSFDARWLLFCALSVAAGTGGPETGLTPDELVHDARVDRSALDEAVSHKCLTISEEGIVGLDALVLPMEKTRYPSGRKAEPPGASTERVRRFRAKMKADPARAADNTHDPVVADSATTATADAPAAEGEESPSSLPIRTDLIFPEQLSPLEKQQIQPFLMDLPQSQSQILLDELAGSILFGTKAITNRVGWTRAMAGRIKNGSFTPENAIPVAERRKMLAAPRVVNIATKSLPPADLGKITDPTLRAIIERTIANQFKQAA
ncbi:MAG: hypothetical protein HQM00_05525 [Magnetococcales bacterium]|nr:hypothetical protein [Magnetococcales bacterium]